MLSDDESQKSVNGVLELASVSVFVCFNHNNDLFFIYPAIFKDLIQVSLVPGFTGYTCPPWHTQKNFPGAAKPLHFTSSPSIHSFCCIIFTPRALRS